MVAPNNACPRSPVSAPIKRDQLGLTARSEPVWRCAEAPLCTGTDQCCVPVRISPHPLPEDPVVPIRPSPLLPSRARRFQAYPP